MEVTATWLEVLVEDTQAGDVGRGMTRAGFRAGETRDDYMLARDAVLGELRSRQAELARRRGEQLKAEATQEAERLLTEVSA